MESQKDPQRAPASLFWQKKPWWCQPWSILLTGIAGISTCVVGYRHFHLPPWLAFPPLAGILGWWLLFLVIVPSSTGQEE